MLSAITPSRLPALNAASLSYIIIAVVVVAAALRRQILSIAPLGRVPK